MRTRTRAVKRDPIHIRLPRLHAAQRQIVTQAARFNVLCAGRRTGKTVLGMNRLIEPAFHGAPVAWLSPTYRMLTEVWRSVKQTLQPLTHSVRTQEHCIELVTGGRVDMWSLETPDSIRGRKYRRVVIDEAAMVQDLAHAWQAAIRPTLTDMRGDAWFLSSPRGHNFFYECFLRGQSFSGGVAQSVSQSVGVSGMGEWRSWQLPTSSNPFIHPDEIEAARRDVPERVFAQEYLAQFLDDGSGVFRRVLEAATATPQEGPQPGHTYVAGCDWARAIGGDFTVFVVLDATTRAMVALDRFQGTEYALQMGRLRALCERWQPAAIYSERNNMGDPLTEHLQREGYPLIGMNTTNQSKAAWVDALALAFERGEITIFNDPVVKSELLAYEATRLSSGLMRYAASAGQHDDTVSALLLAYQGCMETGPLVLW